MVIRSFRDPKAERLFRGERVLEFRQFERVALRKLAMLHAARELGDLRSPPGNRLEKLSGSRSGQYSVRVNDQWRLCFCWIEGNAHAVEMVDYH